ncbi:MAG: hypothetical protein RLZZ450_5587 [Pseudomonadota bacterium]
MLECMTTSLTRGQVAQALDLSVTSVRRLEREGQLRPSIGDGGVHLFSPDEVDQLRSERAGDGWSADGQPARAEPLQVPSRSAVEVDGKTAAEVFRRFDGGDSPVSVVCACSLQPSVVRALHRQWVELSDLGRNGGRR